MTKRLLLSLLFMLATLSPAFAQVVAQGAPTDTSDAAAWPIKVVFGSAQIDPRAIRTLTIVDQVTAILGASTQVIGHVVVDSAPTTPVTGTFWQATQPVSIASMPSTPVTGTFWQATQPVSATSLPLPTGAATDSSLTTIDTDLKANVTLHAGTNVIGHVIVDSAPTTAVTGPLTDTQLRATAVPVSGTVAVSSAPTTAVTGSFWQSTQPVSAASLPLPTGASQEHADVTGSYVIANACTGTSGTYCQDIVVAGGSTLSFRLGGLSSSTFNINESADGTNWSLSNSTFYTTSGQPFSLAFGATANGTFVMSVAGLRAVRMQLSGADVGVTLDTTLSHTVGLPFGYATESTQAQNNIFLSNISSALSGAFGGAWYFQNGSFLDFGAIGGQRDDASTTTCTEDKVCAARLNANRALLVDGSAVTQPVSAASLPLPTGAALDSSLTTLDTDVKANITLHAGTNVIGHVINDSGSTTTVTGNVTATQSTAASLNMTEASAAAIKADVDKLPSLGQALAASSVPVVLTAVQQAALTPPAAITGFALESGGNLAAIAAAAAAPGAVSSSVEVLGAADGNGNTVRLIAPNGSLSVQVAVAGAVAFRLPCNALRRTNCR